MQIKDQSADVVAFWRDAGPKKWFAHDATFDAEIRAKFEPLHLTASTGTLGSWGGAAQGALALLILVDQFPRNIYRGSAHAFATDPLARSIAASTTSRDLHLQLDPDLRGFIYLPYSHSERLEDQDQAVALCRAHLEATGDAGLLKWANLHRDIIARFGRFPHRNACLGRITTPEEQAFLDAGGFAG